MILLPSGRFAFTAIMPQNTAIASQPLHSFIISFVLDPHVCLCHSEIWSTAGEITHCTQFLPPSALPRNHSASRSSLCSLTPLDSLGTSGRHSVFLTLLKKIETTIEQPPPHAQISLRSLLLPQYSQAVVFCPVSNLFLSFSHLLSHCLSISPSFSPLYFCFCLSAFPFSSIIPFPFLSCYFPISRY